MAIKIAGTTVIDDSRNIVAGLGTAGAPSLTFTGDLNTGIFSPGADTLAFVEGGVEAMRIDSSGRLLVGTSTARSDFGGGTVTPSFQFGGPGNDFDEHSMSITREAAGPAFTFANTGTGGNTIVGDGQSIGFITFEANDGDDLVRAAIIAAEVDGTPGANDMPGRLVFSTTGAGTSTPTERMRIDSRGNVFFNSSTPTSTIWADDNAVFNTGYIGSNGSFGMDIVGNGYRNTAGGWTSLNIDGKIGRSIISLRPVAAGGQIVFGADNLTTSTEPTERMRINSAGELLVGYTSDNGAYKLQVNSQIFATSATIATSDGRYKENVATLDGCVDLVKALRPVSFDWKEQQNITRIDDDGNEVLVREGHNFPDGTQVGFIAQEVEEVLTDKPWLGSVIKQNVRPAVTDNDGNELAPEEEFLGIAEGNLVAVLTSALQEAIGEIESLKARLTAAGI